MTELRGASELESYLASLRADGNFEGTGRFTVGSQEKLRKLGDLARANAIRWVFHAVQSAVLSGSQVCRLSVSQDSASVAWELRDTPVWLTDLEALSQLAEDLGQGGDYEHLRQALLWALAQEPQTVSLVVEGPDRGFAIEYSADGVVRRPAGTHPQLRCHLSFEPAPSDRRYRRPAVRAAFHSESSFRLAFCPISVLFDGQELSTGSIDALLKGKPQTALVAGLRARIQSVLLANPRGQEKNFLLKIWRHHLETFVRSFKGQAPVSLVAASLCERPALSLLHPRHTLPGRFLTANGRECPLHGVPKDLDTFAFTNSETDLAILPNGPLPPDHILLTRYRNRKNENLMICLKTPLDCLDARERLRCEGVLGHLKIRGNHLLIQQHGMMLDPVPVEFLRGDEGWFLVLDSPETPVEITGYQAIRGPALDGLAEHFQRVQRSWSGHQ